MEELEPLGSNAPSPEQQIPTRFDRHAPAPFTPKAVVALIVSGVGVPMLFYGGIALWSFLIWQVQ